MMHPLLSNLDCERYECSDAIADAFIAGGGMGYYDQLARAIGHADDYETDEMGACASIYETDAVDRRLYALAATLDFVHASNYDRSALGRSGHAFIPWPYMVTGDEWIYVRSDDRGFWDAIPTDEETARRWLAEWVDANVPTYCECGEACEDRGDPCPACLEHEIVL